MTNQVSTDELKEKIKNMSPEELANFQKQNCIFCQIIEGKIPSKKIYEDKNIIAVLDLNPASPGHLLVLPKQHYQIMPQIPDEILKEIFVSVKKLSNMALIAMSAEGTSIFIANGAVAGQRAQHFMIHVIPRFEVDDLKLNVPEKEISSKEIEEVYNKIISNVEMSNKKEENFKETKESQKDDENILKEIKQMQKESIKEKDVISKKDDDILEEIKRTQEESIVQEKKEEDIIPQQNNDEDILENIKKNQEQKEISQENKNNIAQNTEKPSNNKKTKLKDKKTIESHWIEDDTVSNNQKSNDNVNKNKETTKKKSSKELKKEDDEISIDDIADFFN